jgi:hypothetical protein
LCSANSAGLRGIGTRTTFSGRASSMNSTSTALGDASPSARMSDATAMHTSGAGSEICTWPRSKTGASSAPDGSYTSNISPEWYHSELNAPQVVRPARGGHPLHTARAQSLRTGAGRQLGLGREGPHLQRAASLHARQLRAYQIPQRGTIDQDLQSSNNDILFHGQAEGKRRPASETRRRASRPDTAVVIWGPAWPCPNQVTTSCYFLAAPTFRHFNRSLLESLRIQLILSAKRLGKAFQDTNVSRGNTSGVRFSRCASIPMLHGNRRDDSYALSGADVISALAPLPPPSTSPALSDDANECICQPNVYDTSKADIRTRVIKIASTQQDRTASRDESRRPKPRPRPRRSDMCDAKTPSPTASLRLRRTQVRELQAIVDTEEPETEPDAERDELERPV